MLMSMDGISSTIALITPLLRKEWLKFSKFPPKLNHGSRGYKDIKTTNTYGGTAYNIIIGCLKKQKYLCDLEVWAHILCIRVTCLECIIKSKILFNTKSFFRLYLKKLWSETFFIVTKSTYPKHKVS